MIKNQNSNNNTLTQNQLTGNRPWGIYIVNSYNNTVSNNTIHGKLVQGVVITNYGLELENCSKNSVTSNSLSDIQLGIRLTNSADNYISNNSFTNVSRETYTNEEPNSTATPIPSITPTNTPTQQPTLKTTQTSSNDSPITTYPPYSEVIVTIISTILVVVVGVLSYYILTVYFKNKETG